MKGSFVLHPTFSVFFQNKSSFSLRSNKGIVGTPNNKHGRDVQDMKYFKHAEIGQYLSVLS